MARPIKYETEFQLPEEYVCAKCKCKKWIKDFYISNRKRKTGIAFYISLCKQCHKSIVVKCFGKLTHKEKENIRIYQKQYHEKYKK